MSAVFYVFLMYQYTGNPIKVIARPISAFVVSVISVLIRIYIPPIIPMSGTTGYNGTL